MSAHRPKHLLLVAALTLLLSGCFAGLIAESRREQVIDLARFDSRCDQLKLTDSTLASRYVVEGCGRRYIYSCRNSAAHSHHHHHRDDEMIGFFLTGGLDVEAECYLVSSSRLIPGDRPVATPSAPAARPSAPAPASQPARAVADEQPRAPSAADIKRVLGTLEPQLKRCGVPGGEEGRFQAQLRVTPSGHVREVKITPVFAGEVQSCAERLLLEARLPAFQGERPLTVVYLFHLR